MISNNWTGFDFGLGEDVDMLRDSVRRFSQTKIAPRADEIDRKNEFPRDLWPKLGELGLLGLGNRDDVSQVIAVRGIELAQLYQRTMHIERLCITRAAQLHHEALTLAQRIDADQMTAVRKHSQ